MVSIDTRITEHSYFFCKKIVDVLRNNHFNAHFYTNRDDVITILSIIEKHLISEFSSIVENFVTSFEDVVAFMQLYSANPNPTSKKMLSFRQTCRYIFYLLPSLYLKNAPSTKTDSENMDEFCKLVSINYLIQELNQAYGIQSLIETSCLEIVLNGYYSLRYTDLTIQRLNEKLSKSTHLIHKEYFSEDLYNRLMKTLDDSSVQVKHIFDFTQDFLHRQADVFEVTDEVHNVDDPIIKGLIFDNENVNLLQAIEKPLNPQFRTRFRPLISMNIEGNKRTFTTAWMVTEALEEICTNLLPFGTLPSEWEKIDLLKKIALEAQALLGRQFENKVAKCIKEKYIAKNDISGFNHISLKREKVPNTDRTIGQIDVIAIDETKKIIYVIDAKCNKTKFFFQTFLSDKQSFQKYEIKLMDKMNWIKGNKNVVAQFFKIDSLDDFSVEGFFVSNSLIYYGFFSDIPIIPLDKLLAYLEKKEIKVLLDE